MVGLPMTHAWPSPEVFLPRTEPRTVSCFTLWKHLLSVSLDCQFIQGRNHHPQNIGEKNCGYFYFPWAFCKVSHVNCWLIDWLNLSPIWTPGGDSTHRPRPHQWPFSFIFWQPSIQATNPQRPAHTPCLPKPSPEFTVVSKHLSLFQMDLFSYFYPFISIHPQIIIHKCIWFVFKYECILMKYVLWCVCVCVCVCKIFVSSPRVLNDIVQSLM